MGYRRLYQENLEHYNNESEAKKTLETLQYLFPEVFAWQKRIQRQAHDQQQLISPFGHVRRFYEVFRWDSHKGDWASGDEAEAAIAFLPANLAFGHIREALKKLERAGLAEKYGLVNNVHDSAMFCFRARDLDTHLAEVYPVLYAPSEVLRHPELCPDGLRIDVECQVGKDWANMVEMAVGQRTETAIPAAARV